MAAAPAAATAAAVAFTPGGGPAKTQIAPGVTHERLERAGGQRVHVLRALPGPRTGVRAGLVGRSPLARGQLGDAVQGGAAAGVIGAINGDFFSFSQGYPSGALVADGQLINEPEASRSALIIPAGLALAVQRLALDGQWQAFDPVGAKTFPRRVFLGVNRPSERGKETILYTSALGQLATPRGGSRFEVRIRLDNPGPVMPNVAITGVVVGRRSGGDTTIGAGHVVLTGIGGAGATIASDLPLGRRISILPAIAGLPPDVVGVLGGGPILVRDGVAIGVAGEGFSSAQTGSRTTRSAIGQRADGTILLVTADGPLQGSPGLTVAEQATLMARLGARVAVAMDAGGSSQLSILDRLLPSRSVARSLADALFVTYTGVVLVPLPSRISPNADGVDDTAQATVRTAVAGRLRLVAERRGGAGRRQLRNRGVPAGELVTPFSPRQLRLREGLYHLTANFTPSDGSPPTRQRRRVIVDRTLSHLTTRPSQRRAGGQLRPQVDVGFRLHRTARVTVRILDSVGDPLITIVSGRRLPAGRHSITWNRRAKGITISGTITVQVDARAHLGRGGLQRTLTLAKPKAQSERARLLARLSGREESPASQSP